MIYNFFKTAIRALLKRKMHSFINILGLSVGMAATLLIVSYLFFELSFDKQHQNFDNIYRIYSDISLPNGNGVNGPATIGNLGPKLEDQLPSVKKALRIAGYRRANITIKDKVFTSEKLLWVDSSYFDLFTHKFIAGSPKTALTEPYTVVLTQTMAKRLFGAEDAFNNTYKHGGELYKVSAIVEDIPLNSHIKFEILGSWGSVSNEKRKIEDEGLFNFFTYLLCEENADITQISSKADILVDETVTEKLPSMGITTISRLQPLKDIHLKSHSFFELEPSGDMNTVYIFAALALFIILIAIVNFINLVTANSETRAKEIGLRKVMGAFKRHLFFQFIGEAILISSFSFLIALVLAEAFIEPFKALMDSPLALPYWGNPMLFLLIVLGVITVGFVSGSYPALYLANFQPSEALKGSKSSSQKNNLVRKLLVVFQFTIAIFLLSNLAMLFSQVSFMKNKDLGFDKERIMVVENFSNKVRDSFKSLKADLLMNPNIESVAGSRGVPGVSVNIQAMHKHGEQPDNAIVMDENRVHTDYFKTIGIEIVEGRTFSDEMGTEENNIILNQTAIKELGLEIPIHKKVIMITDTFNIIGICKDFHFKSLHSAIGPMVHQFRSDYLTFVVIKFRSSEYKNTIKAVEQIFLNVDPNLVFDYSFMDQRLSNMYQKEDRINKLITTTSILAIIISMLGLFALTSFTIGQKTQEIGIRKVMGASEGQVVWMFVLNLTQWVVIAAIIAIPLSYYSMTKWLDKFVFHTDIEIWMFTFGCLVALIIAILTVGALAYKAARSNPVDALKYE